MQIFEKEQIAKLTSKKNIPAFRPGDTLRITVKIVEGERSRFQAFEGVCIARKNNSVNSKFTVRKISHGEGVERVFPLFSQVIDKIEVIKKGRVKRAKLYYLRNRTGKRARIADSNRGDEDNQYLMTESQEIISNEIQKGTEITNESETSKFKEAEKKENIVKEELSHKPVKELVAEEKKPAKEKSESTASEADKTKDETKS